MLLAAVWISLLLPAALPPIANTPVEGNYLEDRSNHVVGCYCEWSGESVTGGKDAILGWQFTSGVVDGVSIAGVKIVAVIKGEDSLSTSSAPRQTVLFTDAARSSDERVAAERLVRARFSVLLGTVIRATPARIVFAVSPETASLEVADLVRVNMRKAVLPQDALPGAIKWFDPFVPMAKATLATTLEAGYSGSDFNEKWLQSEPGTRGYFGTFRLDAVPDGNH